MDKVDSLDAAYFARRSDEKKTKKSRRTQGKLFSSVIRETSEGESAGIELGSGTSGRQSLEALLDEVHASGEELLEAQSLENIKHYRQAVKGFLRHVVRRLAVVEEKSSGAGVAKRKRFTQIRIVDQKLERLIAELLASQQRQLDLLGRINEINGLLVDLLT